MMYQYIIQYILIIIRMCITFFCLYPFAQYSKLHYQKQQEQSQIKDRQKPEPAQKFKHKKIAKTKQKRDNKKVQQKNQNNEHIQEALKSNKQQEQVKFIIAFNRDQQCQRRTLKMGPYKEDSYIYAGRDMKSTGTWLGVNIKTGIMVILTNYDLPVFRPGKSRGQLVKSFLQTSLISEHNLQDADKIIEEKLIKVLKECENKQYSAFNLLVYNIRTDKIKYICSQSGYKKPQQLKKHTIYGLCNTNLFNIWPKTKHGLNLFKQTINKVKDKHQQQILNDLIEKVMKDNKSFSNNPNDQASIFIQPFYSTLQNAQRMTKSTFSAIIKKNLTTGKMHLTMKQVTHKNNNYKANKQNNDDGYDHSEQAALDFSFQI